MGRITDTFDVAAITIFRQALGQLEPVISTDEAARRMRRAKILAQCARYGVPVAVLETASLGTWARRLGVE